MTNKTKLKHTPRPWTKHRKDLNTLLIRGDANVISKIEHPYGDDEAEANANLIIQSPAMYDTIEKIVMLAQELLISNKEDQEIGLKNIILLGYDVLSKVNDK